MSDQGEEKERGRRRRRMEGKIGSENKKKTDIGKEEKELKEEVE